MAEWLKAAVLKTVERKFRGFESYFLRQHQKTETRSQRTENCFINFWFLNTGEMTELADGARLLSECGVYSSTEGSNPSLSATACFLLIPFYFRFLQDLLHLYPDPAPDFLPCRFLLC